MNGQTTETALFETHHPTRLPKLTDLRSIEFCRRRKATAIGQEPSLRFGGVKSGTFHLSQNGSRHCSSCSQDDRSGSQGGFRRQSNQAMRVSEPDRQQNLVLATLVQAALQRGREKSLQMLVFCSAPGWRNWLMQNPVRSRAAKNLLQMGFMNNDDLVF